MSGFGQLLHLLGLSSEFRSFLMPSQSPFSTVDDLEYSDFCENSQESWKSSISAFNLLINGLVAQMSFIGIWSQL